MSEILNHNTAIVEAGRRLEALRKHCDAELVAIKQLIVDGQVFPHSMTPFALIEVDDKRMLDVERESDAIALTGAALREAMQPRLRGTLMKKVRKALGYTY